MKRGRPRDEMRDLDLHPDHMNDAASDEDEAADAVTELVPPMQSALPSSKSRRFSVSLNSGDLSALVQEIEVETEPADGSANGKAARAVPSPYFSDRIHTRRRTIACL